MDTVRIYLDNLKRSFSTNSPVLRLFCKRFPALLKFYRPEELDSYDLLKVPMLPQPTALEKYIFLFLEKVGYAIMEV